MLVRLLYLFGDAALRHTLTYSHLIHSKQTMTHDEATKAFGSLLALGGVLGNVGLGCSPLLVSAGSQCKSTPVICSDV